MYEVSVQGRFAAAHNLRGYQGDCEHLHGHNWRVKVAVRAEKLDRLGMAVDFRVLKSALGEILDHFDHRYLNEDVGELSSGGLNPTTENIARLIFEKLSDSGKLPRGVSVARVTVWESPGCSATYHDERGAGRRASRSARGSKSRAGNRAGSPFGRKERSR